MRPLALVAIWAVMLVLLTISIESTFLPIGYWRQAISLSIAVVKASLILWFFMELRRSEGLVRLTAVGAVTFLAIMATLVSADYLTRGWLAQ